MVPATSFGACHDHANHRHGRQGKIIGYKHRPQAMTHRGLLAANGYPYPTEQDRVRLTEADGKRFGDFEMDNDCWKIKPWCHRNTDSTKHVVYVRKLRRGKCQHRRTVIHLLSPSLKDHIKSITTDNGTEYHEMIAKSLGVTTYFADPYASW